jgi:hypothetical protein
MASGIEVACGATIVEQRYTVICRVIRRSSCLSTLCWEFSRHQSRLSFQSVQLHRKAVLRQFLQPGRVFWEINRGDIQCLEILRARIVRQSCALIVHFIGIPIITVALIVTRWKTSGCKYQSLTTFPNVNNLWDVILECLESPITENLVARWAVRAVPEGCAFDDTVASMMAKPLKKSESDRTLTHFTNIDFDRPIICTLFTSISMIEQILMT